MLLIISQKNSSSVGLLESKINKMIYFYPKLLKFQIMCCGPKITHSRAVCSQWPASLRSMH